MQGSPPNIVPLVLALSKSHQFSISLNFSEMVLIDVEVINLRNNLRFFGSWLKIDPYKALSNRVTSLSHFKLKILLQLLKT